MGHRFLLVSGSLRSDSMNTAVSRTLADVVAAGVDCEIYGGLESLPPFNPDTDRLPLLPEVGRSEPRSTAQMPLCSRPPSTPELCRDH